MPLALLGIRNRKDTLTSDAAKLTVITVRNGSEADLVNSGVLIN